MIKIHTNHSLKNNNTFGVNIVCSAFAEPSNVPELEYLLEHSAKKEWKDLVIGEGSNLLFASDLDYLIIHPVFRGIEKVDESESEVLLRVGCGENWDQFVEYCVNNNWYGTENLSLIPGSVGAAPVQNIGAYGCEAKEIIEHVEVYDREKGTIEMLSGTACQFGYRESIFKHDNEGRYIVTNVVFRLQKKKEFELSYGNVKDEFLKQPSQDLVHLRKTIIRIRESKLPEPGKTGNAGSFFKNPIVSSEKFQDLAIEFNDVPSYRAKRDRRKIPAAWLIDKAGWKGKREGDAGTWPIQPLVIVNYGSATGEDIYLFSEKIRNSVQKKFDILLEREVTVLRS